MARPQPAMSFEQALDVLQGMFSEWTRPALAEMLQVRGGAPSTASLISEGPPD
jgi:hypothetical protein